MHRSFQDSVTQSFPLSWIRKRVSFGPLMVTMLAVAGRTSAGAVHADFNGDGLDDMAIGAPGETVAGEESAGAVFVVYGSDDLGTDAVDVWHQGVVGIKGDPEVNDYFGACLAAGDFDGDGFDDLVIGIPGERVGADEGAGAIAILYGGGATGNRLSESGDKLWHQDSSDDGWLVADTAEPGDNFGYAIAVGDFDDDGVDDIAVGAPFEGGPSSADYLGLVHVFYSGGDGEVSLAGNDSFNANTDGSGGIRYAGDFYGFALAAGNFDDAQGMDLAIGVPGRDVVEEDAGAVYVVYSAGPSGGLSPDAGTQTWAQSDDGLYGASERRDYFGHTLAAGDFDQDGAWDLVVGIPHENVGNIINAGAVHVLYGEADSGLSGDRDWLLHQNSSGIKGRSQESDRFGTALAIGDFDNDTFPDLAIGAEGESIGSADDGEEVGAVWIIYASSEGAGLTTADEVFQQGSDGLAGAPERLDHFGASLVVGNFNGERGDDLLIGVPGEDLDDNSIFNAGVVHVVKSTGGAGRGLSEAAAELWDEEDLGAVNQEFDEFGGSR